MLARLFTELVCGLSLADVMRITGAPARTARRWLRDQHAPPWVCDRLHAHRYGIPVTAPGWEGFVFRDGDLWTPENVRVLPAAVRALPYLTALNRELQRKLAEPQQWKLL